MASASARRHVEGWLGWLGLGSFAEGAAHPMPDMSTMRCAPQPPPCFQDTGMGSSQAGSSTSST
jgi:hypothetical protein